MKIFAPEVFCNLPLAPWVFRYVDRILYEDRHRSFRLCANLGGQGWRMRSGLFQNRLRLPSRWPRSIDSPIV